MKTQTALKSGLMSLSACRNVKVESHPRGNVAGNKVYATCPFHGFWVDAGGWFPATKNVVWNDDLAKLTGIAKK